MIHTCMEKAGVCIHKTRFPPSNQWEEKLFFITQSRTKMHLVLSAKVCTFFLIIYFHFSRRGKFAVQYIGLHSYKFVKNR